jgi:hypothetical protein
MIGLIAHSQKMDARTALSGMISELSEKKIPFELESQSAALAGLTSDLDEPSLARQAELLVVMGGDGTILRVVHKLGATIKPAAAFWPHRPAVVTTSYALPSVPVTAGYMPVTVARPVVVASPVWAPTTVVASPVIAAPVVTNYAQVTNYAPVTTYAAPVTTYRPVTTYYSPVTTYAAPVAAPVGARARTAR